MKKLFGLLAIAGLLMAAAPAQQAQALSLANPATSGTTRSASEGLITQVRHGGHGHWHGARGHHWGRGHHHWHRWHHHRWHRWHHHRWHRWHHHHRWHHWHHHHRHHHHW